MRERTVRLSDETWAALQTLADRLGATATAADPERTKGAGRPAAPLASTLRLAVLRGMDALRADLDGGQPLPPPSTAGACALAGLDAGTVDRAAAALRTLAGLDAGALAALAGTPRAAPPSPAPGAAPADARTLPLFPPVEVEAHDQALPVEACDLRTGDPDRRTPPADRRRRPTLTPPDDESRGGPRTRRERRGRRAGDPPERRGPERLTAADAGAWVRKVGADGRANGKTAAHVYASETAGGFATFVCGESEALPVLARVALSDGSPRGRQCEACKASTSKDQ